MTSSTVSSPTNVVKNPSGLRPLGVAILVLPYEPEIKKSVIAIPDSHRQNLQVLETRGIVVAIGSNAWHDEPTPRAKVGDKVMLTRLEGVMVKGTKDGVMYRLVNDKAIFCEIEVEDNG